MRVLVTGDRHWEDNFIIRVLLDGILVYAINQTEDFVIIEGGARGADRIAKRFRPSHDAVEHITEEADWDTHGKSAGPIRNRKMIDAYGPDFVLAFHDSLDEVSKGTKDCVDYARSKGIPVYHIQHID